MLPTENLVRKILKKNNRYFEVIKKILYCYKIYYAEKEFLKE